MTFYISPPPQNPLARLLSALVAVIVLAGAFMLGIVALAVVAGLGLLVWLGVWLRMAWVTRQLRGRPQTGGKVPPGTAEPSQAIETEYTVISRKRDP